MPDEAREVIFPRGVPVTILAESPAQAQPDATAPAPVERLDHTPEALVTPAEGGLSSEADTLDEQARQTDMPDDKEDLLRRGSNAKPTS
jgi:hypothetical protein